MEYFWWDIQQNVSVVFSITVGSLWGLSSKYTEQLERVQKAKRNGWTT